MKDSISNSLGANRQDPKSCRKFLAGDRLSFHRAFWKNTPAKKSDPVVQNDKAPLPSQAKAN